jgi:hypothetical protein
VHTLDLSFTNVADLGPLTVCQSIRVLILRRTSVVHVSVRARGPRRRC